jgi:hypothetical protein
MGIKSVFKIICIKAFAGLTISVEKGLCYAARDTAGVGCGHGVNI